MVTEFLNESDWCTGTIPYKAQKGLWRAKADDSMVSESEYSQIYLGFSEWLKATMPKFGASQKVLPCYFIGDFTHDRTQQLQFTDYAALCPDFVRALQRLLRGYEYRGWRIAISARRPEDVIIVYPNAICTDHLLSESEIDVAILEIRDRALFEERKAAEALHNVRERVKAHVWAICVEHGWYLDRPLIVCAERRRTSEDKIVELWIAHGQKTLYDLDDYTSDPDACVVDAFTLSSNGTISSPSAALGANSTLVALWEFQEAEDGCLTLELDGVTYRLEYISSI